jgi:hypothetical protein
MSRVVMDRREASQDHDNRATPEGRYQLWDRLLVVPYNQPR